MKTSKIYFLIIAIILFSGSISARAYDGVVTMGFGDSITQGYPYVRTHGNGCHCGIYEQYLEKMLTDRCIPNLVFNWGIGGETTAGGLNRIDSNIQSAVSSWGHVNFVLLMEGTNDYIFGISKSTTVFNLSMMIDTIRRHNITPVIGTLTPDTRTPHRGIPEYNTRIRNMAASKNVALVDHYAAMVDNWKSTLTYDGLHPNMQGYYQMAAQWSEMVEALLGPGRNHCNIPTGAYLLLLGGGN